MAVDDEPEGTEAPPPEEGVKWVLGPGVRADILAYSGVNVSGAEFIAQIYASGFRRGTVDGDRLRSIVIGAPYGTRLILCATTDEVNWEDAPWRAIRILEGQTYKTGLGVPAVRVPDIDWLDPWDQKRSNESNQQSYPYARRLADGTAWTFGTGASLHNRVRMIRVEREDRPISSVPLEERGETLVGEPPPDLSEARATDWSVPRAPAAAPAPKQGPPASIASLPGSEDQWRLPTKR